VSAELTVWIPTRDRAPLLRECLERVADQGLERGALLVHVSDNASDAAAAAATAAAVEGFRDRLELVYERAERPLSARENLNRARGRVATPYTAFLCDDDLLPPGQLGRALGRLEARPDAVVFAALGLAQRRPGDPHARPLGMLLDPEPVPGAGGLLRWGEREWLANCFLHTPATIVGSVFRTDALPEEPFPAGFEQEADRLLFLAMTGRGEVLSEPWIGGHLREHPGQQSRRNPRREEEARLVTARVLEVARARGHDLVAYLAERLGRAGDDELAFLCPLVRRRLGAAAGDDLLVRAGVATRWRALRGAAGEEAALVARRAGAGAEAELARLRATRGVRAVEAFWRWKLRAQRLAGLVRGVSGRSPAERAARAWSLARTLGPAALGRALATGVWHGPEAPGSLNGQRPSLPAEEGPPPRWPVDGPTVSALLATRGPPAAVAGTIASVRGQRDARWELCLAGVGAPAPAPPGDDEGRVRVAAGAAATEAEALNAALELASGELVVALAPGGRLDPHALAWIAAAAADDPTRDLIYADEDRVDAAGRRSEPDLKPGWSPDYLLSRDYVGCPAAWRRALVEAVGGFRPALEGAHAWDLTLRVAERARAVHRVPRVLYHQGPGAPAPPAADRTEAGRRALEDALARRGERGRVVPVDGVGFRVQRDLPPPGERPRVAVIVPTRDRLELLRPCLEGVLRRSTYAPLELIVIDNGSVEPATRAFLAGLTGDPRVRVLRDDGPFDFSRLNDRAARATDAPVLCFLNNDTEVVTPDWIEAMLEHALRPEVGAVGAKLLYPDGTVQHAGVVLGVLGSAGHVLLGRPADDPGPGGRAALVCNYSAVTGACLMVRREAFRAVDGFANPDLRVSFGDVDLCLRLAERGLRTVYTPFACLIHHESATRPRWTDPAEDAAFQRRWGALVRDDPCYHPRLTRRRTDFDRE